MHPTDIEHIFEGVTLAVYHMVEILYCCRLGRSIKTVWQILNTMACRVGVSTVTYEAVWAICSYLDERRRASVDVSIEQIQIPWWVGAIVPDIHIQERNALEYRPLILGVVDTQTLRVLSFRIVSERAYEESVPLALYDALVLQRRPQQYGAAGLIWQIPRRIITEVPFSQNCHDTCTRMGTSVEAATTTLPFLQTVRDNWADGLAGRVLQHNHCAVLLDTYLDKMHGYGPLREREQHDQKYAGLIGYNKDPTWQFPLLRSFLPQHPGVITQDGVVAYDDLHYTDDLLSYWPRHPVTLRRSAQSEAMVWVYLDGEVLCQAMARELRRHDGSYRTYRPGR